MEKMHALEETDKPEDKPEEEEAPKSPTEADVSNPAPIIPARM
jgi:hypothetical protein